MRENKIKYRLNKIERILVSFSVFHGISQLFLGTFVVSFLMHNSLNEIVSVSVYNLFFYVAIALSFVFMVNQCKKGNIKLIFGLHIIVKIILMILLAMLGNHTADWVIVLGLLYGVQDAFYNMSTQQMIIDKVNAQRMVFYYGTNTAVTNIVKILVPVILGTMITIGSLQNMACVMVIMGLIEFGILFMLSPSKPRNPQNANLGEFIRRSLRFQCVRKLFVAEFLRGVAYILETVGIMYIVYVFHTDMNLGAWTTFFALVTAGAMWGFGRFCSRHDFKWIIRLCSILLMGAIIYLAVDINRFSVLAYTGMLTLTLETMNQVFLVNVLNLAKTKYITKQNSAEYLAAREVVFFCGRWGGVIAMLYVGVFGGYGILPYLIIILAGAKILSSIIYVQIGKYTNAK